MNFASILAGAAAAVMGTLGTTTTPMVAPVSCVNVSYTLSVGSKGDEVVQLQRFLGVKPTGFFGPLTQGVLTRWQISAHVISTAKSAGAGTTGPKTRAAMRCNPQIAPPSTPKIPAAAPALPDPVPTKASVATTTTQPVYPGGGGGSVNAPVNRCPMFTTPKPPASGCQWDWQLINDEADCPALWECSDPNATQ